MNLVILRLFEFYIVMPKQAFEISLKKLMSSSVSPFSLTSVFSKIMSPSYILGQKKLGHRKAFSDIKLQVSDKAHAEKIFRKRFKNFRSYGVGYAIYVA